MFNTPYTDSFFELNDFRRYGSSITRKNLSPSLNNNNSSINSYNNLMTQSLSNDTKRLQMLEKYMDTQNSLGVANSIVNGISGLTSLGLGIDSYLQNKKLSKETLKNMELSNEQLIRDMEYIKNERNRLNKMRNNTSNVINSKSSTSKVYV